MDQDMYIIIRLPQIVLIFWRGYQREAGLSASDSERINEENLHLFQYVSSD